MALVQHTDIVVTNMRPAAKEKLHIDYDSTRQHNPQIIYISVSTFHTPGITVKPLIAIVFTSELFQRMAQTGMQMLDLYGQRASDSKWAPLAGATERLYLGSASRTIAAGTSEMQRNILAERGLELLR